MIIEKTAVSEINQDDLLFDKKKEKGKNEWILGNEPNGWYMKYSNERLL